MQSEHFDTVIIGGGQSGLAVGYHLTRQGREFVILDAGARVGDAWRHRWDSLLLFTPARYNGLPGMRFPASGGSFATKDSMANYLETYAKRFDLPVRLGTCVESLSKEGGQYVVLAGGRRLTAANVVIAMGSYQRPKIPPFAADLRPDILQLHSSQYRNGAQLRDGAVLVVGVGNSGADIALDVARSHATVVAGKEPGAVPFRIEPFIARNVLVRIVRFVGHHVLSVRTPMGRKLRPKLLHTAAPLVRVKPADITACARRTGRVTGVRDGLPVVEDGSTLDVNTVIWCTGYHPGFSWIDLPVFDANGDPMHRRGVVPSEPGLYFVGLHFLTAMTSDTITGMQRDAAYVAHAIARRTPAHPVMARAA